MKQIEHALRYLNKGYSVIPCNAKKKLILKTWAEFQRRRPTEAEVKAWYKKNPGANIGIICGATSNLTVVDCDSQAAWESLKKYIPDSLQVPIVCTPSGNYQVYFKHTPEIHSQNRIMPDTDIKAEGSYVIAPPSICNYEKGGKRIHGNHRWLADGIEPPEMPAELACELRKQQVRLSPHPGNGAAKKLKGGRDEFIAGVPEGYRNDTAAKLAGDYIRRGLSDVEVLTLLLDWNKRNLPPLPERELQAVVTSIRKTDSRKTPLADSEAGIEEPISFEFIHNSEILADLQPLEWRICDVLPDYALYHYCPNVVI